MKATAIGIAAAIGCAQLAFAADDQAAQVPAEYQALVAKHSRATGVPASLIHRVIMRESRYRPTARHRNYYGMMQIMPATARSMGYQGPAGGLLDADVNLTYGVRYLAGAYKVAGGNHERAVRLYASGYYYDAKRRGMLAQIGMGRDGKLTAPPPAPAPGSPDARTQLAFSDFPQTSVGSPAAPQAARTSVAAVPLPPARGPAPVVIAAAAPVAPALPVPTPRPAEPQAAAPVLAAASPAVPVPPVRDVALASTKPEPTTTASLQRRTIAPDAAPVIASAAGPVPPLPPTRAAPVGPGPRPATALAANLPVPTPPVRDAVAAPRQRVISATTQPVLAGAGPILAAPQKPREPVRPTAAAPAAPELAFAEPQSAPPMPKPRGGAGFGLRAGPR
ncbi:transglycosylase SLT domain-containing protein [Hansschlegelia sp. KR7-227]|uniref:transglycosylase SLT domain-containing protein n=1 Tax=Hansschlegelia sp. KR7-227 TaxID=3400914 RepID=UPI003C007DFC